MGNSSCLLASDVSNISDNELNKLREDEQCLRLIEQQLPITELTKVSGLSRYKVFGVTTAPKSAAKPEAQELALLCLQDNPAKLADKFVDVRTALQNEIKNLDAKEPEIEISFKNSRLQALCRVYDALLRQEERERRRVEENKQTEASVKVENKKDARISPLARAGLGFGVEVLLSLVEIVGAKKPRIVSRTMDIAVSVLSELQPLELANLDSGLTRSVQAFGSFFQNITDGGIPGLDASIQMKAIAVVLGLAIAKGDYTMLLSFAQRFLCMEPSEEWAALVPHLVGSFQNLRDHARDAPPRSKFSWRVPSTRPSIVISNDNLTLTHTDDSTLEGVATEQILSEGVHFVEIKIDQNKYSSLHIGVCPATIDLTATCPSTFGTIRYFTDGRVCGSGGNMETLDRYGPGDRVGLLIDMDEKTLAFYKNGERMNSDAYTGLQSEVRVYACFGDLNQIVSIENDPNMPEGVRFKKGKPDKALAITPWDIAYDPEFDGLTKLEGTADPSAAGSFILAALAKQGAEAFWPFDLDTTKSKVPKNFALEKSKGLEVDIKPQTFAVLIDILEKMKAMMEEQDWSKGSFKLIAWASLSAMRILLNHLFTAMKLRVSEEEIDLTADTKARIRAIVKYFSLLKLEDIGVESTPESDAAGEALRFQALLANLHSFDLFFPTPSSKLEFALSTLYSPEVNEKEKKVASDMLMQFSEPMNLFRILSPGSAEDRERVKRVIGILTEKAIAESKKIINGVESNESRSAKKLLVAQSVLFGQLAKTDFSSEFLEMAKFYIEKVLAGVEKLSELLKKQIYSGGTISEALEVRVRKTMLRQLVITLLRTLMVLKFDTDFSAYLLTVTSNLRAFAEKFSGGRKETITSRIFETQVFESEHPYPNSADITHSVKVPGALFYTLTFDKGCCTEKGCNYLQLWNGPDKTTEVKKWTGGVGIFSTETFVAKQPELFFTFHSAEGMRCGLGDHYRSHCRDHDSQGNLGGRNQERCLSVPHCTQQKPRSGGERRAEDGKGAGEPTAARRN